MLNMSTAKKKKTTKKVVKKRNMGFVKRKGTRWVALTNDKVEIPGVYDTKELAQKALKRHLAAGKRKAGARKPKIKEKVAETKETLKPVPAPRRTVKKAKKAVPAVVDLTQDDDEAQPKQNFRRERDVVIRRERRRPKKRSRSSSRKYKRSSTRDRRDLRSTSRKRRRMGSSRVVSRTTIRPTGSGVNRKFTELNRRSSSPPRYRHNPIRQTPPLSSPRERPTMARAEAYNPPQQPNLRFRNPASNAQITRLEKPPWKGFNPRMIRRRSASPSSPSDYDEGKKRPIPWDGSGGGRSREGPRDFNNIRRWHQSERPVYNPPTGARGTGRPLLVTEPTSRREVSRNLENRVPERPLQVRVPRKPLQNITAEPQLTDRYDSISSHENSSYAKTLIQEALESPRLTTPSRIQSNQPMSSQLSDYHRWSNDYLELDPQKDRSKNRVPRALQVPDTGRSTAIYESEPVSPNRRNQSPTSNQPNRAHLSHTGYGPTLPNYYSSKPDYNPKEGRSGPQLNDSDYVQRRPEIRDAVSGDEGQNFPQFSSYGWSKFDSRVHRQGRYNCKSVGEQHVQNYSSSPLQHTSQQNSLLLNSSTAQGPPSQIYTMAARPSVQPTMNEPVRQPVRRTKSLFLPDPDAPRKNPYSPPPVNSPTKRGYTPPPLERTNSEYINDSRCAPRGHKPMISRWQGRASYYPNNPDDEVIDLCDESDPERPAPYVKNSILNVLKEPSVKKFLNNDHYHVI